MRSSVALVLLCVLAQAAQAQRLQYNYLLGKTYRFHFHSRSRMTVGTSNGNVERAETADADIELTVESVLDSGRAVLRVRSGNLKREFSGSSPVALIFVPEYRAFVDRLGNCDSVNILTDVPKSDKYEYGIRKRFGAYTVAMTVFSRVLPTLPVVQDFADSGTYSDTSRQNGAIQTIEQISYVFNREVGDSGWISLNWRTNYHGVKVESEGVTAYQARLEPGSGIPILFQISSKGSRANQAVSHVIRVERY